MPELVREFRDLAEKLSAQELLDPSAAETTRGLLTATFAEIEPALRSLRSRQDEIITTLHDRLDRPRRR